MNQVELTATFGQQHIRDYCDSKGILVESYGSVSAANGLSDDATVRRIAEAHGRSAEQVLLRHSLQRGCLTLARSTTPAHIADNLGVFDFELSDDEEGELDGLERGERTYWDNSEVP